MAFGVALIFLEDYKTPAQTIKEAVIRAPHFGYKMINGVIQRVIYKTDKPKDDRFRGYKPPRL